MQNDQKTEDSEVVLSRIFEGADGWHFEFGVDGPRNPKIASPAYPSRELAEEELNAQLEATKQQYGDHPVTFVKEASEQD